MAFHMRNPAHCPRVDDLMTIAQKVVSGSDVVIQVAATVSEVFGCVARSCGMLTSLSILITCSAYRYFGACRISPALLT